MRIGRNISRSSASWKMPEVFRGRETRLTSSPGHVTPTHGPQSPTSRITRTDRGSLLRERGSAGGAASADGTRSGESFTGSEVAR